MSGTIAPMYKRPELAVLLIALASAVLARPLGTGVHRFEVGAFEGGFLAGDWGRSGRLDIDPPAATDDVLSFYYRPAGANTVLRLPVTFSSGALRLTFRATARVRSGVSVFSGGERVGDVLVTPAPWNRYSLDVPVGRDRGSLDLAFALRPLPLVRGDHIDDPTVLVDYFEVEAPAGLELSYRGCLLVGALPIVVFVFLTALGVSVPGTIGAAIAASAVCLGLLRIAPFAVLLALPRLVPLALLAGWLAATALRRAGLAARTRAALAVLVAAGVLGHGSLVFFPNHNPPDLDIHVRRTGDLTGLPLEYQALMRYGSQLPTASQDKGAATAALGDETLIPYSPLPYLFYYAARLVGLDLYWAMTALNAAVVMLVAPCLFLTGRRLWGDDSVGFVAAVLYTLDLAVWHHVGRSHAPAAFGGALATAALALLAARAEQLDSWKLAAGVGFALGVGALGYSSTIVLYGLLGVVLMHLLAFDAHGISPRARRGVATALALGGLVAGVCFYFHYMPGLLAGARGVEAQPDLFPGKAFFIFHNESRQSLRLWALGLWMPLLLGLACAPIALARARAGARPVLIAWLSAWALIMLLKEPFLFPRLLRWAKEDQFLTPLLCLFVAAACAAWRERPLRIASVVFVVLAALLLELRDFALHANSLGL